LLLEYDALSCVAVPPVVALPDSFLGYFLALNRSALRYAFPSSNFRIAILRRFSETVAADLPTLKASFFTPPT
jgi:hypothetical protein